MCSKPGGSGTRQYRAWNSTEESTSEIRVRVIEPSAITITGQFGQSASINPDGIIQTVKGFVCTCVCVSHREMGQMAVLEANWSGELNLLFFELPTSSLL